MSLSQDIHVLLQLRRLDEMLQCARQSLQSPLILADLTFRVLSLTPDDTISDPRWTQICTQRFLPLDMVNVDLFQSSLRQNAPIVSPDSTGLPIVRSAVAQDGRLIGYLFSPCYGGEPTVEQLDLIRVLSDLCAVKMQKELHYAEYPENMPEFFLSDLLNGTVTEEEQILDCCRFFHWNLNPPYRVLTIRPAKGQSANASDYPAMECAQSALQSRFSDAAAFLYGGQIKMILPVRGELTQDKLLIEDVATFLNNAGLTAGVSQVAYHLRKIAGRHTQAMRALEMGTLLNGAGPLYDYDRYAVYHCLELCAQHENLLGLCHSALLKLESYDRKNGTELLSTLHAYLSCRRNLSEAADSLYVHRNTLAKRLAHIADLVQVDLHDTETVFHLLFSYRILEYYGATVMRDSYETWMERSPNLRHK